MVLANQKGGVGKSAIACQLAYFHAETLRKRVLVIDLDHQANTTAHLRTSGVTSISALAASRVLSDESAVAQIEDHPFLVIHADAGLLKLERQPERHNQFANQLQAFLQAVGETFDLAIIDTNPNPDIRVVAALVVADFVLAPIQLNQEAVDGIIGLRTQIMQIQRTLNPSLHLIGLLPNMVMATPFQRSNMEQLCSSYSNLLIRLKNGQLAAISNRTAVAEAQASGKPIWKIEKTSGREAWTQIKPIFEHVAMTMGMA